MQKALQNFLMLKVLINYGKSTFLKTEAAIRGVLCKKVFLEISQNFNKAAESLSAALLKKRL